MTQTTIMVITDSNCNKLVISPWIFPKKRWILWLIRLIPTHVSPPIFGQALGPPESPDSAASENVESDGRHGGWGPMERAWKGLAREGH
jgi:hypothetical protein